MQFRTLFPVLGSSFQNGSRAFRTLSRLPLLAGLLAFLPGVTPPPGEVNAAISGLRSAKGQVLACLTANPEAFPRCDKDPDALAVTVPARESVEINFGPVPRGKYAIALVHDENANGKLDRRLMMPREGFGFSRNAPVGFGPPPFNRAAFEVNGETSHQSIRMRYLF